MTLWKKIIKPFQPDEGLMFPEIQEIEAKISDSQNQADTAEFQFQLPHIKTLQTLKSKSDAERIRQGLSPKYHSYSEKEKEELLKKYPSDPLSYFGQLKKFAKEIGISQDEINRYKNWIKFYGTKNLSDTTIFEFLICQKIGISQDEITRYKKWVKFYGTKNLSDTTIFEFFIRQKTKKNPNFQNSLLIQRIQDRRSTRRTIKFKRTNDYPRIPLKYYFRRYLGD